MKRFFFALVMFSLGSTLVQAGDPTEDALRERMIKAGLLPGYLQPAAMPSGIDLLPAPPGEGSAAAARDREGNERILMTADSARKAQAKIDAATVFPGVTTSFACALGIDIGDATTPSLYRLLRRSLADFGLSTRPVKQKYLRPRPFMVNGQPPCTPNEIDTLRNDGSYPSGHSAYGFGWGLILASVAPDRTDTVIRRGIDFGDSRQVCNVHWPSDVEQGRVLGAAVFARLQSEPEFRSDLEAARKEVAAARASGAAAPANCQR